MTTGSLLEQLGGPAAVDAAVDLFYRKVLADQRIRHFFEGVDMNRQAAKQKAFLAIAFGGPGRYGGRSLRNSHSDLVARGLNDSHFDAVVELLAQLGAPAAPWEGPSAFDYKFSFRFQENCSDFEHQTICT